MPLPAVPLPKLPGAVGSPAENISVHCGNRARIFERPAEIVTTATPRAVLSRKLSNRTDGRRGISSKSRYQAAQKHPSPQH